MMKINQNVILKALTFLLCFYIAIMPIFQYKTVKASAFDKARSFTYIVVDILVGLKTVGFISDTALTPENLENIYNKADAYLHENFGTELEYAEALRQVDQLGLDIASGQIFVPGNYSGKLWYSFLNAIKDVLFPYQGTGTANPNYYLGIADGYEFYFTMPPSSILLGWELDPPSSVGMVSVQASNYLIKSDSYKTKNVYAKSLSSGKTNYVQITFFSAYATVPVSDTGYYGAFAKLLGVYPGSGSSAAQYIPNITAKTANKVKLPTRLPQTVINNINNYIDNSTENLIIAPTAEDLPTLPDNYNPVTDDPPDLPGYEDVTPDQPGTTDPEPTPSPTPEPTPTPPEYDGSSWIKPIGDFFEGLLSFLKDALIPTQTVDFSPLQNMGADVSGKFPFSLPGDIGKLFGVLNAEPIRPHFEMDFDLSKVGIPGEPIHWDLNVEQWDNGAAVVKTALYIAFLIGLVFITKQFMQN